MAALDLGTGECDGVSIFGLDPSLALALVGAAPFVSLFGLAPSMAWALGGASAPGLDSSGFVIFGPGLGCSGFARGLFDTGLAYLAGVWRVRCSSSPGFAASGVLGGVVACGGLCASGLAALGVLVGLRLPVSGGLALVASASGVLDCRPALAGSVAVALGAVWPAVLDVGSAVSLSGSAAAVSMTASPPVLGLVLGLGGVGSPVSGSAGAARVAAALAGSAGAAFVPVVALPVARPVAGVSGGVVVAVGSALFSPIPLRGVMAAFEGWERPQLGGRCDAALSTACLGVSGPVTVALVSA